MRKFSRNIAIAFSLIFLFPLLWQSVHQIEHADHHHCQACHDELQFSLPGEDCAICSYEFAISDVSSNIAVQPRQVFSSFRYQPEITVYPESFRGFNFCLRAPPVV